jgi:hypothetical protein
MSDVFLGGEHGGEFKILLAERTLGIALNKNRPLLLCRACAAKI